VNTPHTTSAAGRRFIENVEGLRLTSYQDSRGIWTIGVGHTGPVDGVAVHDGMTISDIRADALLTADLAEAEADVGAVLSARSEHADPPTQATFDALVSLVFNIGGCHFRASSAASLTRNGHPWAEVAAACLLWRHAGANPVELASRRAREAYVMLEGLYLNNSWKQIQ
jgi:lysozyme